MRRTNATPRSTSLRSISAGKAAMLSAKEVLPIDGRAARTIRSPPCKPAVNDPLGRLRDLFAVRDPLYRETAHRVVRTSRHPVERTAIDILAVLPPPLQPTDPQP